MKKALKIGLIVLLVIIIIGFGTITWFSNNIFNEMTDKRVEKNSSLIETYADEIDSIETESSDGLKISSWRFKKEDPEGIVIVLHGMDGQDASSLLDFGKFFSDNNYETFCLDMRAHGKSEGNKIGFGYTEVKDVKALLDWINSQPKYENEEIILYGISMGGATAINTAAERSEIDKVISVSAFQSTEKTFLDYMRRDGVPEFVVQSFKPSIRLLISSKYDRRPIKNAPISKIRQVNNPILLIHGDQDQQILIEQAYNLKEAADQNAELWVVEDKKHMVVTDILSPDNAWYRERILEFID